MDARCTRLSTAFILGALATSASACGGDRNPTQPGGGTNATLSVSAMALDSIATGLYAHLSAGADVTSDVTQLLGAMMPVVVDGQDTYADSLLATGTPFLLPSQPAYVAAALEAGETVPVDAFVAAADSAGATLRGSTAPLSRDALTAAVAAAQGDTALGVDHLLAGVVLALGRARVKAAGGTQTDAVWGDGRIDPLQELLLLYAVDYAGATTSASADVWRSEPTLELLPAPQTHRDEETLEGFLAGKMQDKAQDIATDALSKELDFPLDKKEAAKASICASVLLYSYKFKVSASPFVVWHHDPQRPEHPWKSLITATLNFDFVPNSIGKHVLPLIGCDIPPAGPADGRNVGWSIDDTLENHGALDLQQPVTDDNGVAIASYVTKPEVVPTILQAGLNQVATGSVGIVATGLLPGKWKNLERAIGLGIWSPTESGAELQVQYYKLPQTVDVTFHSTLSVNDPNSSWSATMDADLTFSLGAAPILYVGKGPATYANFSYVDNPGGCGVKSTGTQNGQIAGFIQPDSTRDVGLSMLMVAADPMPQENYETTCSPDIKSSQPRFWNTFVSIHGDSLLNGMQRIADGHAQRTYNQVVSVAGEKVNEVTVVDLIVTKP